MEQKCPECGKQAKLFLAVIWKNENIPDKGSDWKLACGCGNETEGAFSTVGTVAFTLLYLAPVIVLWGIFLIYGEMIEPAWFRFVVWLIHVIPGVLIGNRISSRYAAGIIRKQIGTRRWKD